MGTENTAGYSNLLHPSEVKIQGCTATSSTFKLDTRIDSTKAVLSSHNPLQSTTSPLCTVAVMSHSSSATDTSNKAQSAYELQSTVKTTHDDSSKLSNTSCAVLPSVPISTPVANMSAVTRSEFNHPITVSQTTSLASSERIGTNKKSEKVAEILSNHNYHQSFASSPLQPHIPRSKCKNARREAGEKFVEERRHKPRKDFRYTAGSMTSSAAEGASSQSCSKSRRTKCSHCNNGRRKSSSHQSHTSTHQTPYDTFCHYNAYTPYYMPPSVLASVSYYSYYLGAYDAHVRSMHYYNMLSHQPMANMWQQQADYIRKMAQYYTHR